MEKNKETLRKIQNFFYENNVNVPIAVSNSIEDVFDENSEIEITDADIYFKEDLDEFKSDLFVNNSVSVNLTHGSRGKIFNTYTYYGNIEFALHEIYTLSQGVNYEEVEVLHDINNGMITTDISDTDDWAVVLFETVEFENGQLEKSVALKIYCPESCESEA